MAIRFFRDSAGRVSDQRRAINPCVYRLERASRGALDTSALIDHNFIAAEQLPDESAITAVTLAELAAGPHATENKDERARRQDRLQWATANWDPLPFDADSARMYGRVFAAARAAGQSSRVRFADLLIASTAASNGLCGKSVWSGRWESKISLTITSLLES